MARSSGAPGQVQQRRIEVALHEARRAAAGQHVGEIPAPVDARPAHVAERHAHRRAEMRRMQTAREVAEPSGKRSRQRGEVRAATCCRNAPARSSPAAVSKTITRSAPASSCCAIVDARAAARMTSRERGGTAAATSSALASEPACVPSTAYTNSVHGPPTNPIRPWSAGSCRARRRDGFGLERQRAARPRRRRRSRASSAGVSRRVELRAVVVVAQAEPSASSGNSRSLKRIAASKSKSSTAPARPRPRAPARGRASRSCAASQRLVRLLIPARLAHQPDRRHRLRLAGERAREAVVMSRLPRPPTDSRRRAPIESVARRRRQRLPQPHDRVVDGARRRKLRSWPQTRSRISDDRRRAAPRRSAASARGRRAPAGTCASPSARSTRQRVEIDLAPARAHDLGRALRRQHVPHAQDELLEVKRLRQVLVGADLEAFEPVLGRVERRHEHHRRSVDVRLMCRARPKPEPSGSFTSTIARSQRAGAQRALRPSAIVCTHVHVELLLLEPLGQRPAERRVVFDEQHARHQRASGRSSVDRRTRGSAAATARIAGRRASARRAGAHTNRPTPVPLVSSGRDERLAELAERRPAARRGRRRQRESDTRPDAGSATRTVTCVRAAVDDGVLKQVAHDARRTPRASASMRRVAVDADVEAGQSSASARRAPRTSSARAAGGRPAARRTASSRAESAAAPCPAAADRAAARAASAGQSSRRPSACSCTLGERRSSGRA